ncbi:VOC family protein [Octadecabacter sp. 1_MG-2023]|uniref:VOC family protein n=1 Tax=unclassified Octadecabacter TaxID=196158 RepID=UPI001C09F11B|nr:MULTISPECIES: VOC family protein [unclassified Octadecabacter]MBU2992668.1 VOC family protein [Octadecabacter sp. B2R22]MDO6733881.1 VOC family protein [Octadecabacter sp. 1_MG-2023]
MIRLDAVAVSSKDMAKTVAFYELLGFEFPKWGAEDQHVEPITKPGDVRLMIDTAALMEQLTGHAPVPPNHSSFAMLCDTPAEVDAAAAALKAAGHTLTVEPWDAFWGQRYATVKDPDGYQIDLFAEL